VIFRLELVSEQRADVCAPGEPGIKEQSLQGGGDVGEPGGALAQGLEAPADLGSPLRPVKLGRKRADGATVELQLAMWITARSEQQHRAAQGRIQLGRLDERVRRGEQGERGPNVRFGAGLVQHGEHAVQGHGPTVDDDSRRAPLRFGLRCEALGGPRRHPDLAPECQEDLDHYRVELCAYGLAQPAAGLLDR
jgi:hypothetical protein